MKQDLNDWNLGRVVLVQDTGFISERNRRILQGAGGHYIIGEKMRLGRDGTLPEALGRGGKYQKLGNGLEAKEVIVGGDSEARRRFVIVGNPEEAGRDKKKRDDILREVERRLNDLGHPVSPTKKPPAGCEVMVLTDDTYVRQKPESFVLTKPR